MGRDHPDGTLRTTWVTLVGPPLVGTTQFDEVVARLSGIHAYNRLGSVVWHHSFETTSVQWKTASAVGADSAASISTTTARNGDKSLRLRAGPLLGSYIEVRRRLPYVAAGGLGLEMHVALAQVQGLLQVSCNLWDGVNFYGGGFRWYVDPALAQALLGYTNSTGAYTDVSTTALHFDDPHLFHAFKVVFSTVTATYGRLYMDGVTYDLAGIPVWTVADTTAPHMDVLIRFTALAAVDQDAYVDDVIVTQLES